MFTSGWNLLLDSKNDNDCTPNPPVTNVRKEFHLKRPQRDAIYVNTAQDCSFLLSSACIVAYPSPTRLGEGEAGFCPYGR